MKVTICSIIKDEQLFLKEWIDYHISIGVDDFFLCEDTGSKSHKDICDSYPNVKIVSYDHEKMNKYGIKGGSIHQENVYRYFIETNPTKCDWVAFIDLDEFIYIEKGNIKELLENYIDYPGLYLSWKFYGASGHIERPSGNVQDNYTIETDLESDNGWRFKSIANMNKNPELVTVHNVKNSVNTHKIPSKRIRTFYKAYIKHYFSKSWEDWITRFISRGDTSPGHRKLNQFFELNPDMLPKRKELMDFYYEKLKEYKDGLQREG